MPSSYDSYRRTLANRLWNWNTNEVRRANAATERDRNRALGEADAYRQMDFTVPQRTIDRDLNTMTGEIARYRSYTPEFSTDLIDTDREAMLDTADTLRRGGSEAADRTAMLERIAAFEGGGTPVDTGQAATDRAALMRGIADYQAESSGLSPEVMDRILSDARQREDQANAQALEQARKTLAAQGQVMSPWLQSQMQAMLTAASEDRLASQRAELEIRNYELRDSARRYALAQTAEALTSTRRDELSAREADARLGLTRESTGLAARGQTLDSTRRDSFARETAAAELGAGARNSTRGDALDVDRIREELTLRRDTEGLALLDRVLAGARSDTRENQASRQRQQENAAELVYRILSGTERAVMDPGAMASLISNLAG